MKAIIFDVEHGFCAMLIASNKKLMLLDAGINATTEFRPSRFLKECGYDHIEYFVITNYDEDHVSDCPQLIGSETGISVNLYRYNKSISVDQLIALKQATGGIGPGLKKLIDFRRRAQAAGRGPDFNDFEIAIYQNNFPTFDDTNNLSLLTFVRSTSLTICFPGDLEEAGWFELLKSDDVREWLAKTNILVAAHHGRESGFCPDVFQYANPKVVIVSDGPVKYDSQLVDYGSHARGLSIATGSRRVLTTRKDGTIYFDDSGVIPAIVGAEKWEQNYVF